MEVLQNFFDGSSGNFHLMPPEDKVEEKCPKKEIEEKRNNVYNLLKLNKKQGWDLTRNGKKEEFGLSFLV